MFLGTSLKVRKEFFFIICFSSLISSFVHSYLTPCDRLKILCVDLIIKNPVIKFFIFIVQNHS